MTQDFIRVRGAAEHNLKSIDVDIPRDRLVVITGLSGSGKSSLAFDTIYAEGQRRYVESLSAYARQFLGQMEKPNVESIEGLSPAISIEQRSASRNPRSTVATVTEIYDYLRLLFARIGVPYCWQCGRAISRQTVEQMVDRILGLPAGARVALLAPIVRGKKGEHRALLDKAKAQGFVRVRVNGVVRDLEEEIGLPKTKKHDIEVVVDRLKVEPGAKDRLADSLSTALAAGEGVVLVDADAAAGGPFVMSEKAACAYCGVAYDEIAPRTFSFNSPYGACPTCDGIGFRLEVDPDLVVPNADLSIGEGAIAPLGVPRGSWVGGMVKSVASQYKIDLKTPWKKLPREVRDILLFGSGGKEITFRYRSERGRGEFKVKYEGTIANLERRYRESESDRVREWIAGFMTQRPCKECGGARLKREALSVKVGARSVAEVTALSVRDARAFFEGLTLSERDRAIAVQILKEVNARLRFLDDVGLSYLTLERSAGTLSGGEAQRIRLATQIGSGLTGVLYVLDEPSIGLHSRDNRRLLDTLYRLRDLGNTVLVVEHDRETMESADHLIDLGPGAGAHGGRLVASGTPEEVRRAPGSITGEYLRGRRSIALPPARREGNGKAIEVLGARANNLKTIDVRIPLGRLVCVTGVSGSGKSTLVNDILLAALARHYHGAREAPGAHRRIAGLEHLDKVIAIDQSPIGRTPRSNPATYTGVFTPIRDLFARLPESKVRGYEPGRFSFNVRGGRCEACQGDGTIRIEMHFLPDVFVKCEVCKGRRYSRETLEVHYKGKSIADVLEMTVDEALAFFEPVPAIRKVLETLHDVGLGYIHLGQSATTLSGGEAQRVKLSTELARRATGRTMYILDEPTTGLHFEDVRMLLAVLDRLVEGGNTALVIEHNLDVVKTADWIIDLGPEGGDEGGRVVAAGTPEEVAATRGSHTGESLAPLLEPAHRSNKTTPFARTAAKSGEPSLSRRSNSSLV
jgi:excinuclease ABC subunit A